MKMLVLIAAVAMAGCSQRGDLRGPLTSEDVAAAERVAEQRCAAHGKKAVVVRRHEFSVVFDCVE